MTREVAWQRSVAVGFALLLIALVALIGGSSISAAPSGLVAAYSFDEGAGTTLIDRSGNGNGGSISGAGWTTGRTGGALSFDGVNDVVNIPDSNSLDISQMTLEAWVRLSTLGNQWRTVVIKEKPKQLVYALYAYTNGPGAAGNVNVNGSYDVYAQTPSLLPTKTWVHLATTYDGTTIRLFVNGEQIATKAQTGKIVASNSPLRIGGNTVWGEWFTGLIDDLRIYNRPLSQGEIKADMSAPVANGGGAGGSSSGGPIPGGAALPPVEALTSRRRPRRARRPRPERPRRRSPSAGRPRTTTSPSPATRSTRTAPLRATHPARPTPSRASTAGRRTRSRSTPTTPRATVRGRAPRLRRRAPARRLQETRRRPQRPPT